MHLSAQTASQHRARTIEALQPGDLLLVPAAGLTVRNNDVHHRFRQDSDFRYLTAFPEPNALAVIQCREEGGVYTLFVLPKDPKKEVWEQVDQKLRSNPVFKSILEGSFIRPASYVKPKKLPTQDQLKDGFTVECFINTQQKPGIHHVVCNGGSWEESGFSLLTVGGVIRGELQNTETQEKILMDMSLLNKQLKKGL